MLAVALPLFTVGAQSPAPAPYQPPTIALVRPLNGGTVPRDKPVVVFRFARGEAADPIDTRTFAVSVDGVDRTAHFQVTAEEAWGALVKPGTADSLIALGPHVVTARLCSVRGACAEATSSVVAVEATTSGAAPPNTAAATPTRSTRTRVIELLLDAVRKLIVP